jgi:hypothetical protein
MSMIWYQNGVPYVREVGYTGNGQYINAQELQEDAEAYVAEALAEFKAKEEARKNDAKHLFLSPTEFAAKPLVPSWLVGRYIERAATGLLWGDPDTYKSFIALDLCLRIAAPPGLLWRGAPLVSGPVYYIAGEGGGGMRRRVEAWCKTNGHKVHELPFFLAKRPLDPTIMLADMTAQMTGAMLIVLDTFSALSPSVQSENSAAEVGRWIAAVNLLRDRTGATVLIIHHAGKEGQLRGSSAFWGNVDFIIKAVRPAESKLRVDLWFEKMKDAEKPAPLGIKLEVTHLDALDDFLGEEVASLCVAEVEVDVSRTAPTTEEIVALVLQRTVIDGEHVSRFDLEKAFAGREPRSKLRERIDRLVADGTRLRRGPTVKDKGQTIVVNDTDD